MIRLPVLHAAWCAALLWLSSGSHAQERQRHAAGRPFGMVQPGPREGAGPAVFSHTGNGHTDILVSPVLHGSEAAPGEQALPGYYRADFQSVRAELTAARRVAMHRYTFDAKAEPRIAIALQGQGGSSTLRIRDRQTVTAHVEQGAYSFHVHISFSASFTDTVIAAGAPARFRFAPGMEPLRIKVALSSVGAENAVANMHAEMPGWDFDMIREGAEKAWERELSKIDIRAGDPGLRAAFYAALHRCFLRPSLYSDANGSYLRPGGTVQKTDGFDYYTAAPMHEAPASWNPLLNIISKKKAAHFVRTFVARTEAGSPANGEQVLYGHSVLASVGDAILTGNWNFDLEKAQEAMKGFSNARSRDGMNSYLDQGFVSREDATHAVARTMQFALEDWCVARVSAIIERRDDEKKWMKRAKSWKNLFDPVSARIRPRFNGGWPDVTDHVPVAALHDLTAQMRMMGGEMPFELALDSLFGNLSAHRHESAPHHEPFAGFLPYLYNYVPRPGKAQDAARLLLDERIYGSHVTRAGDAWLVFASLGMYPVTPGTGIYAMSCPRFDTTVIHLENGRDFLMTANTGQGRVYIDSASLRGMPFYNSYMQHNDILMGGDFAVYLTDSLTGRFGTRYRCFPSAYVKGAPYLPAPVIESGGLYFDAVCRVSISSLVPGAEIRYIISGAGSEIESYSGPLELNRSARVTAFVIDRQGNESPHVSADFRLLPYPDRHIRTEPCGVPPFTAGGPEALIDGLQGDTTLAGHRWRGCLGNEIECVIDLGKETEIRRLAAGFLSRDDIHAMPPGEVVFSLSGDGTLFSEILRLKSAARQGTGAYVERLSGEIEPTTTRYVKMRAVAADSSGSLHDRLMLIDEVSID